MGLSYGFFNSLNGDRTYDTVQISELFDGLIRDGVFLYIGTSLGVTAGTGMHVNVGEGRAWFNHTWTKNDSSKPLDIDTADLLFPRIDAIIIEVDASENVRANDIKVIKGTAGNNPQRPTLINSGTLHQYPLAYVSVPVVTTSITQGLITKMVGTSACPYVTGPLELVNTEDLYAAWELEFTTWFDNAKGQLDTDPAGHLQNEIDDLPSFIARQGHATDPDWNSVGVTSFPNPVGKIQFGNHMGPFNAQNVTVTFPIAFSGTPLVFCQSDSGNSGGMISMRLVEVTATHFVVEQYYHSFAGGSNPILATTSGYTFNWMAIGPV
jgi:hypothetical protein